MTRTKWQTNELYLHVEKHVIWYNENNNDHNLRISYALAQTLAHRRPNGHIGKVMKNSRLKTRGVIEKLFHFER